MRTLILTAALLALPSTVRGGDASQSPSASPIRSSSNQLVVVRTAAWWASVGTLQRYERSSDSVGWRSVGGVVPVNLGRAGMGWGRGLHPSAGTGPQKREGDGRSPAGVFRLTQAFGAADALPPESAGFAYTKSLPTSYCVEDARSPYYNQLIDASRVAPSAWEQRSPLLRPDGLFDWGVVVEQNAPSIKKAAGSCVFLHIWRGQHRPTSGCTAMPRPELEEIIRWLVAARDPLLVQLPEPVFQGVRQAWGLP